MSLFRKVGEKFEETKQSFISGAELEYVCTACEKPVDEDHEHCPHCGERSVALVE